MMTKGANTVVMFSPLPPRRSGIADYTFEILLPLSKAVACSVVVEDGTREACAPAGVSIMRETEYIHAAERFTEAIHIYQIGNNIDHVYMLPFLAKRPGIVVIHDTCLHHLLDNATLLRGDFETYRKSLQAEYGAPGSIIAEQWSAYGLRERHLAQDLPMLGGIVRPSRGVIVHSRYAAVKVLAQAPDCPVTIAPHQFIPPEPSVGEDSGAVRARFGVRDDELMFLSLGFMARAKRIDDALRALASVRRQLPPFRYVIAGALHKDELDIEALVDELGLRAEVTLPGYVDERDFFALAAAADVVINLRYPVGGETSGTMIRALGSGACVVIIDRGPFAEIPNEAVVKLAWGPRFPEELAETLLRLAGDPVERARIGGAARRYIETHHSVERTVAGYLKALATRRCPPDWFSDQRLEFPPPRERAALCVRAIDHIGMPAGLPTWFRAGFVPNAEPDCRVVAYVEDARDAVLLRLLGHGQRTRRLNCLLLSNSDQFSRRSIDLAVVLLSAAALPSVAETTRVLNRLNRLLAFGGALVVTVKPTSEHCTNPIALREHGGNLLAACGFEIERTLVRPPPDLLDSYPESIVDERCWLAYKVSEFSVSPTGLFAGVPGLMGAATELQ